MHGAVLTGVAGTLLAAWLSPASAADSAAVSTPSSPQGWYLSSTHTDEDGAMTPTSGRGGWAQDEMGGQPGPGSVLLTVDDAQRARLETTQFNRYSLGELQSFAYSSSTTGYAPSLSVAIDPVGADDYATLVWEAGKAGLAVREGVWQSWDTSAGPGWWTPSIDDAAGVPANNSPTDFATVVELFGADSEVLSVAIDVGRHGPMTAHVDGVSVTTEDGTAFFDVEPDRTPTSKADCDDGGFALFTAPSFGNQRDCVSFVRSRR